LIWRFEIMTNSAIPAGKYDGEIVGIRLPRRSVVPSGTKIDLELIAIGQRVIYYIPPGDGGDLAWKNILYFADCPLGHNGNRDYRQLIERHIGVEIESLKHADGQPYVRIKRFFFSEVQLYGTCEAVKPKKRLRY
jgi:hypothetical protein